MQAERIDRTPEWRHDMGDVEGIASHPAMQAKSMEQLREKADEYRAQLAEAQAFPPSADQRELVAEWKRLLAATNLAVAWREGRCG